MGDYRTLQGQAPYLINSGISYTNPDKGIQTGIFYNVQGKTLEIVGDGFRPDVYRRTCREEVDLASQAHLAE